MQLAQAVNSENGVSFLKAEEFVSLLHNFAT